MKNVLRALKYRNYRLYFAGQLVSLVGTWMQQTALSWLVYRLTGSPFLLGVVGFSSQIPSIFLSPFAGVLADRVDKKKILIITQALSMLQSLILSFLVLSNRIEVWHIIALSIALGLVIAFDAPARQSFVVHLVEDRADLGNAIALNSSIFNGARLTGPALAGILIKIFGEGICFLINGISYLAVIVALFAMKTPEESDSESHGNIFREMKEGFLYSFNFTPVRALIIQIAMMSFFGMSYAVLMPDFVSRVLHGGAQTLGFMMGFSGAGALAGAFILASRKSIVGLSRAIPIGSALFGASLIAFSFSGNFWMSALFISISGFGFMIQMASCNTLLQTLVEDRMRGRVMSIYTTAFFGVSPFGSLMAGSMAGRFGSPGTLAFAGVAVLIGALIFALQRKELKKIIHPIYMKMGILPDKLPGDCISPGNHSEPGNLYPEENQEVSSVAEEDMVMVQPGSIHR